MSTPDQKKHRPKPKEHAKRKDHAGSSAGLKNSRNKPDPAAPSAEDLSIGDVIVVTVKKLGINGEGVGYFRRKAVFIPGALPGEVVKAKVTRTERQFMHASLTEIEKKSPDRQQPPCPVYEACGGCQLQHMTYEAQLRAKEQLVRDAFERYTGLTDLPLRPIFGMDNPWRYRNKAQLQVGVQQGGVVMGLYSPGTHQLVDIGGCPIQHPLLNEVVGVVKRLVQELHIPVYKEKQRSGVLRTVVARIGYESSEVQLTFVTAKPQLPQQDKLIRAIRLELPQVVSISQNINAEHTPLIFGDRTQLLWGGEKLEDRLGDVQFSLSPRAFFQLNPEQTIRLYDAAKEAAGLTGNELVVDAYCGTGTIALWLAPYAKSVRGIELIPEAIEDARLNAARSGRTNAEFFVGHAEELLPQWVRQGLRPDVVTLDPPRTGCDSKLLTALLDAKPPRIVYVSCNPSTLAKDCKTLLAGGYRLKSLQPVDMFPQTSHVECVAWMERGERA